MYVFVFVILSLQRLDKILFFACFPHFIHYLQIGELAEMSNSGNTRIDVDIVKKYSESTSKSKYYPLLVENVKVLQDILLRNLSPYDINGVINLMYAFRLNATTNEIQSALVNIFFFQFFH